MKNKRSDIHYSQLNDASKKEILKRLVSSLLNGLDRADREEILNAALAGHGRHRDLIDMVGH